MNLQKVLTLKTKVEEEYKKKIKTIDDFINLYRQLEGESSEPQAQQDSPQTLTQDLSVNPVNESVPSQKTDDPPKRVRGLRDVGVSIFQLLPDKYTKVEVRDVIERERPEWRGKITRDALDGVMKEFVRRELAVMIVANSGTKPALYRKAQSNGHTDTFSLQGLLSQTEKA